MPGLSRVLLGHGCLPTASTAQSIERLLKRGEVLLGIALAGPDPRIELRRTDNLDAADIATLNAKLDRMDRAADQAWTRSTLRQISRLPGVVSTELAAEVGEERRAYKLRVRRLKALGLTESLERGYRLSPRGQAYLAALDSTG